MTLIEILSHWRYEDAAAYYLQHGKDRLLRDMLLRRRTTVAERDLRTALDAMLMQQRSSSPTKTELELKWRAIYRNAARKKTQLADCPNDDARLALALTMLDEFDQVSAIWALLDNKEVNKVEEHHDITPLQETDAVLLKNRLLNNRSYISRNKSRTDKHEEVARREAENKEIEKLLV